MPWEKGQSGNPGGRPKELSELKELARQYTHEALETLASIMKDKEAPPAARVSAANSLLDRGYGKPALSVEAKLAPGGGTGSEEVSALDDLLREALGPSSAPANEMPRPESDLNG